MDVVSDDYMRSTLREAKTYTVVILRKTRKRAEPGADDIVWEHGRRNFQLRRDGKLLIVCPVNDGTDVGGLSIFSTGTDETRTTMDEDPAVRAGIFTYEVHPVLGFPGDSLT